ncbi:MAG: RNA polymerase sigma factor [Desulfomonile tiedjei]|uniref:RNA polymerase sigma factor n=1 Tax=Desulfomonile tiedjei TaxID=2358 RepID=A0A9D6V9L5_9BACT|nr:RNA polymerase sigma factor [Desulfomonile tiedjei]
MTTAYELQTIDVKNESSRVDGPLSSDMEEIRLSLDGDGAAYERLVGRYEKVISARMWRFTRDTFKHRELVQDVFVEAYLSLKTFRGKAPFEHWLSRIATTVGYRHWRTKIKERSNRTVPIEEWDQATWEEPESMEPEKAAEILHSLLERLPPRDRLVLMLRHVENRSIEETAELTGWSRTMVKVQAWRARNKLKKLFEAAGLEVD